MNRLENVRNRGDLIVAAIQGDEALQKFVTSHRLTDYSAIANAKAEAQRYFAEAAPKSRPPGSLTG
jgi:hypothetical protein